MGIVETHVQQQFTCFVGLNTPRIARQWRAFVSLTRSDFTAMKCSAESGDHFSAEDFSCLSEYRFGFHKREGGRERKGEWVGERKGGVGGRASKRERDSEDEKGRENEREREKGRGTEGVTVVLTFSDLRTPVSFFL